MIDHERVWLAVEARFSMPPHSIHGPAHWRRVEAIGLALAEATGADRDVVHLFACFHDSRRETDGTDPDHGRRGAALARSMRGELFDLADDAFALLEFACTHHTDARTSKDPTIATCWDADRLDLARLGFRIERRLLSTAPAKRSEFQGWATSLCQLPPDRWGHPEAR